MSLAWLTVDWKGRVAGERWFRVLGMRCLLVGCLIGFSLGDGAVAAVDYGREIKPLLKERCYACHGALKQKAGLRLDTVAAMREGGDSGDVLEGQQAMIVARVITHELDDRMPPEGEGAAFTAEQVELLQRWVAEGAKGPSSEQPEPDPKAHWAYHRPESAGRTLDELLAVKRAELGVKPQPAIAPSLWLRRVYLDLIGLPPTRAEQLAFEMALAAGEDAQQVRAQVVERLLASPQYGERWARHFMDIWRYSDWYGLGAQLRYSQKHLWHWRDWIVESLNADKGYDEMVRQMLAADEIDPADKANLRATGFLARSFYLFNRTTWLDATIEHTSRAFLGLTMQCVKCHDHKYDPVDQAEYYRMRAIFEPMHVRLDAVAGETDFEKNGLPRVFDLHLDRPTYRHVRGDEANEDRSKVHAAGVPAVLSWGDSFQVKPVNLPMSSHRPGAQVPVMKDHLVKAEMERAAVEKRLAAARQAIQQKQQEEAAKAKADKPVAAVAVSQEGKPKLLWRDEFTSAQAERYEVLAGDWQWLGGDARLVQTETGSQRRVLEWKEAEPSDFAAKLKFVIEGGERWKSVGLAFDGVGEDDTLVYVSAAQGGSKVQVSPRVGGSSEYPAGGARARAVETGREYLLEVRVRGRQIEVWMDGERQINFALPTRREGGKLRLVAFDARASFRQFEVRELDASEVIGGDETGTGQAKSIEQWQQELALIQKEVQAAEAKIDWIKAVHAAEAAPQDEALAQRAAEIEAKLDALESELALSKAERGIAAAGKDSKQQAVAAKQLKEAKERLEKAELRKQKPGVEYRPLRAVLKAQEGPDDPANASVQRFPQQSTGRRLAFAQWVTDRQHPLTARVLVNQVWLRHFGASLVEDVTDFGRRTLPPLQQAVLDTLAARFIESGWSLKALHREMVLSELYAMSSSQAGADPATLAEDPDNRSYWRMNARRMESQVVRDSLLHLVGRLDLTQAGPTLDPTKNETANRRALYFNQTAFEQHRFLGGFDNANVLECYRREVSVMPQQALALSNSRESAECAAALAEQWGKLSDERLSEEAFWLVLGRAVSGPERAVCVAALQKMSRPIFLQGLLNHNDFITIR